MIPLWSLCSAAPTKREPRHHRLERSGRDLKAVRHNGVADDLEEHSLGVCATGVAFRDPLGNSVAISVPVPSQRFKDESTEDDCPIGCLKTKAVLEQQIISRNLLTLTMNM